MDFEAFALRESTIALAPVDSRDGFLQCLDHLIERVDDVLESAATKSLMSATSPTLSILGSATLPSFSTYGYPFFSSSCASTNGRYKPVPSNHHKTPRGGTSSDGPQDLMVNLPLAALQRIAG
jgi:hypothetical protein